MAESETSNTSGIVAIFAILVMLIVAAFFGWRAGVFDGGESRRSPESDITAPEVK